jgi:hypothetical protein
MKTGLSLLMVLLVSSLEGRTLRAEQTYTIVDTGQSKCFDNRNETSAPKPSQLVYAQNAQFLYHPASYTFGVDGQTVRDNVTGLTPTAMASRTPPTN